LLNINKTWSTLACTALFVSFSALCDRIGGSQFEAGAIIQMGTCETMVTHGKVSIEIKIRNFHVIKGGITPYTALKTKDLISATCSDLHVGQIVVVGYAQGNDTPSRNHDFTIIDSITVMKKKEVIHE
jgi:hypothetical protein